MALLPKPVGEKNSSQPVWDHWAHQEWASLNRGSRDRIQLVAGGQPRPKAVRHNKQISKLVAEFSNGQRTLVSFLSALANTVVHFS